LFKIQISRLERVPRIQNHVILLVKKFFVCRPIDTPDSEVDTRKTGFWCVQVGNPCDTSSDTAKFCCVWDTACPAKETIFTPCRPFSEKLFSCGHGVSSLRSSLKTLKNLTALNLTLPSLHGASRNECPVMSVHYALSHEKIYCMVHHVMSVPR
jgi:hypothetical protein